VRSREERASAVIAERLAIEPGDPIMVTDHRFFADDEPMQLSVSYEPLAITRDTPVELLESADIVVPGDRCEVTWRTPADWSA
jgi:DNA-binding GntR family transcriptional regulator